MTAWYGILFVSAVLIGAFFYLRRRSTKSLLFVIPDYHCSFFLRDELRARGWLAEIFVPYWYEEKRLYARDVIFFAKPKTWAGLVFKNAAYLAWFLWRYDYFYVYSADYVLPLPDAWLRRAFGASFRLDLALLKFLRKRLVYQHSGCYDIETRENFSKLDGGKVCFHCGSPKAVCNDTRHVRRFNVLRRYMDAFVSDGSMAGTQYPVTALPIKSLDLDLWSPDIAIPPEFCLPASGHIRIMHSFWDKNRTEGGRNVKGSPYVVAAIEKLKNEGHPVEYFFVNDAESWHMRFYQAQADIIVEQLLYGWWGSTGVEAMALGKPVVCYLRPAWKEHFLRKFPEYDMLPIIEADTATIYDALKKLVTDAAYRHQKAKESREFAQKRFDKRKNVADLEKLLLSLDGGIRKDTVPWPQGTFSADGRVL